MSDRGSDAETNKFVNLKFETKNQVKLFIGERSKTAFDSGCKMLDLHLSEPYQFEMITFQNYYTAYLSIKAKLKPEKSINKAEWIFLLKRHKLMESAHGETGANQKFTISNDMMLTSNLKNISQLRIIMQQPSTCWKDFGIDDIKLKLLNPELQFDKILSEYSKKCEKIKKNNFEKLPPIEDLSNRLQNLWSLCNESSKQTKNDLEDNPRFDIDGIYDVNLLSYSNT